MSRGTVRQLLIAAGISIRTRQRLTDEQLEQAREL